MLHILIFYHLKKYNNSRINYKIKKCFEQNKNNQYDLFFVDISARNSMNKL